MNSNLKVSLVFLSLFGDLVPVHGVHNSTNKVFIFCHGA